MRRPVSPAERLLDVVGLVVLDAAGPGQDCGGEAEACPDVLGAQDPLGASIAVASVYGSAQLGPATITAVPLASDSVTFGALCPQTGGLVELGLGVHIGFLAVLPPAVHRYADPAYRGPVG